MINIEWILLIVDYFRTLTRRDFIFEWLIPVAVALYLFKVNIDNKDIGDMLQKNASNIISLLGVLVGFSIAVVTLLVTSGSENIELIKSKRTTYYIGQKNLSLFDVLLINYTYSIIIEVFLVIVNVILMNLQPNCWNSVIACNVVNTLNIYFTAHVLLLTVRNITNFYFVLSK